MTKVCGEGGRNETAGRGAPEKGEGGLGSEGRERLPWRRAETETVDGKLERNSNFRPHFSSSINSYLYATPCFLSIRARCSLPAEFPQISRQICQSVLRRGSRIRRPTPFERTRNCQSCEYSSL